MDKGRDNEKVSSKGQNLAQAPSRPSKWKAFWERLRAGLAHAFAVEKGTEDELTEEEIEVLEILAKRVVRMNMAIPAIMFLESVRPLNFIGSQVMLFFRPIIDTAVDGLNVATSPFGLSMDMQYYNRLQQVLEKRASIEALIVRIERLVSESEKRELDAQRQKAGKHKKR